MIVQNAMCVAALIAVSLLTAPAHGGATVLATTIAAVTAPMKPVEPIKLAPAAADSVRQAIEKDRTDTENWLKTSPTSYLATILRRDFEDKATLVVGSAPSSDVRIDDPEIRPQQLRVTVSGDSFLVAVLQMDASFKIKGVEQKAAVVGPSSVEIGRYTLRLSHQRFPAIIVFDPQSPRFKDYKGLKYFPVDLAYRYEAPLTPNPATDTLVILSTRGNQRRAVRVGWFDLKMGGKRVRLEATRLLEPGVGENDFGLFFRDATTGKETYGVGRYVDAQKLDNGNYLVDFNQAYNPACAFSEHYNCPIPPKANTLKVAIRAGEMDSHYH